MFRTLLLSMTILACDGIAAHAADLPAQSRLGAIFVEQPAPRPRVDTGIAIDAPIIVFAPQVDIPPLVNGYYGKPNSYRYDNYYGTSAWTIYSRLPYACGFVGYC